MPNATPATKENAPPPAGAETGNPRRTVYDIGYAVARQFERIFQRHGASEAELAALERLSNFEGTLTDVERLIPVAEKHGSTGLVDKLKRIIATDNPPPAAEDQADAEPEPEPSPPAEERQDPEPEPEPEENPFMVSQIMEVLEGEGPATEHYADPVYYPLAHPFKSSTGGKTVEAVEAYEDQFNCDVSQYWLAPKNKAIAVICARDNNPIYRVPAVTVLLGSVLDLDVARYQYRLRVDAFDGWTMLAAENAIDQRPGYAKLYLVKGDMEPTEEPPEDYDYGSETYSAWYQRDPEKIGDLSVANDIGYYQGRVLRIGYRSDKYHKPGEEVDYDHLFIESGGTAPKIYTDRPRMEDSKTAVIVGGDFKISERGIE